MRRSPDGVRDEGGTWRTTDRVGVGASGGALRDSGEMNVGAKETTVMTQKFPIYREITPPLVESFT